MKHLYKLLSFALLLILSANTFAQLASAPARGSITGKVRSKDGKPAGYVNVQIIENNRRTLTKEDGTFSFHNLKAAE